ncbi:hypothetical protein BC835DRAFT_1308570 [Cytidiella melzeri]|nr:hypothetical protein BC835DRAFT_1308570 [Cytidiella melzeri]
MYFSVPFVLSAAIVFGVFHTVTVSAMPYSSQGSGSFRNVDKPDGSSTDGLTVLPSVLTTRGMRVDYPVLRLSDQAIPANSKFNKKRLHPNARIPGSEAQLDYFQKISDATTRIISDARVRLALQKPHLLEFIPNPPRAGLETNVDVLNRLEYCAYLQKILLAGRYDPLPQAPIPHSAGEQVSFETLINKQSELSTLNDKVKASQEKGFIFSYPPPKKPHQRFWDRLRGKKS